MEITDDKNLPKEERKKRQIEKAPNFSPRAKVIKLADRIANLTDIMESSPTHWTLERRQQYVVWSRQVVDGCRGHNPKLEKLYDPKVIETRTCLI